MAVEEIVLKLHTITRGLWDTGYCVCVAENFMGGEVNFFFHFRAVADLFRSSVKFYVWGEPLSPFLENV